MRSETGQPNSLYSMEVWPRGQTEPDGWHLSAKGAEGALNKGSALLLSHHTDVTFGEVTCRAL